MVHSKLDDTINYIETRLLEKEDESYDAPIYDYVVLGETITIAIGQSKYNFIDKNIIYYPVYIIKNDKVHSQIGLYEILHANLTDYMDEDGDIDIVKLGEPLLYSFFKIEKNGKGKEKGKEKEKNGLLSEQMSKMSIVNESESQNESDQSYINDSQEDYEYESTDENEIWINDYLKSNEYNIIDNEGGGDCLFASIRDGLRGVGKNISVQEMRNKLALDPSVERVYKNYKELFEMYKNNLMSRVKK